MTCFRKLIPASMLLPLTLAMGCSAAQSTVDHNLEAKVETVAISSGSQYMKPGAAIDYSYELPAEINAGQTVTFQLILSENYNSGIVDVSLKSEGALQLFATNPQSQFDMSAADQHSLDISFTAKENGRHYINVQAITDKGEPRIFSIVVQVGPKTSMKPDDKMMTTESGENIIVMEAEEEIK